MRLRPALAASALLAAAPASPLAPGAWTFTNTPGAATLDGRPLADLPVGAPTQDRTCLTPDQARTPARWLARDIAGDCTLTKETVAGGRVDVAGTCPAQDSGQPAGSLAIRGTYAADRYDLTFQTVAHGENGAMAFSGAMRGRRTGACAVSPDRPPAG